MHRLQESFTGKGSQAGWQFTQLHRNDIAALYKKHSEEFNLTYYEVFKIRRKKEKEVFGKIIPAHEGYPSDNDFGEIAWCYSDMVDSFKKYIDISGYEKKPMNVNIEPLDLGEVSATYI